MKVKTIAKSFAYVAIVYIESSFVREIFRSLRSRQKDNENVSLRNRK